MNVRTGRDVGAGDVGKLVGQPGHPQQELFERLHVDRGSAAVAEQQRRGPHGADELCGVDVGQWQDAVRTVTEEVGRDAALPGLYPPNAENRARYEKTKT